MTRAEVNLTYFIGVSEWAEGPPPCEGWWDTKRGARITRRWWNGKRYSWPVQVGVDDEDYAEEQKKQESGTSPEFFLYRGLKSQSDWWNDPKNEVGKFSARRVPSSS